VFPLESVTATLILYYPAVPVPGVHANDAVVVPAGSVPDQE